MKEWNDIVESLRKFAIERNWEQFHSPKNLAAALVVEAAELLESFQWLTEEQSHKLATDKLESAANEIADVQIYLMQLADKLGVDVLDSVNRKNQKNAERYSVDKAYGSAEKIAD